MPKEPIGNDEGFLLVVDFLGYWKMVSHFNVYLS